MVKTPFGKASVDPGRPIGLALWPDFDACIYHMRFAPSSLMDYIQRMKTYFYEDLVLLLHAFKEEATQKSNFVTYWVGFFERRSQRCR